MEKIDSVLQLKDYGRIRLKLSEYMDEHHISRNALAKKIDTRFEVISKWYKNDLRSMDLDILARICYVLGCEAADILEYEQGKQAEEPSE